MDMARVIVEVQREDGMRRLLRAVCQQWVSDGKPKHGKDEVLRYAKYLKDTSNNRTKDWYNKARRIDG